jgi:hypothetical protein
MKERSIKFCLGLTQNESDKSVFRVHVSEVTLSKNPHQACGRSEGYMEGTPRRLFT